MLDFSEIPDDGTQFELLIREILFNLGHHVIWSGIGPDGGRDLVVREDIKSDFGRRPFSWLVQCKHFAKSKRIVSVSDLDNIIDSCSQHGTNGYLLATSTFVSSAVVNRLEGIKQDQSKHLETSFWDSSIIERLLGTPENWGIAQRFMPLSAHAEKWQISNTTHPNNWIVNFRGHHIILTNRIESSTANHFSSIKHRVEDIEKLELGENQFIKTRSVYYDDKGGNYLYYLDYMVLYKARTRHDTKSIARALGDGYALEDGQTYDFDIRVVRYLAASDHYDQNHYDYYVPYTGSFLVGEPRPFKFDTGDKEHETKVDYRPLIEAVDAARDSAFRDFCNALKEVPSLKYISGENACMELVALAEKSGDLLNAFCDWSFRPENLTSCAFAFRMIDERKCLKMFEALRQDLDVGFTLHRNYVYAPKDAQAKYEDDDFLHFLRISLGFCDGMDSRALRNRLNLYLTECAARIRDFVRRNRS